MKSYHDRVTFQLGNDTVGFTPEGCISIFDAITALTGSPEPHAVLKTLAKKHPEITGHIRLHRFEGPRFSPVTDGTGLDIICTFLFDELYR